MSKVQNLIATKLGKPTFDAPAVPVSFRCSIETAVKMDLLLKFVGYSSRSKLLSELVPAAIEDALSQLSEDEGIAFSHEFDKEMQEQYEVYVMENT